nr:hypothetical protein [Psychrobacter sp. PraFG1]UNK05737.1 hypothetical protein MN210_02635 [Psychrobacter sp. PraFG1]
MMFFRPEVYQLRLKFRAVQALTLAVTVSLSSQAPAATSALINVQEQPDTVTAKAFNSFAAPYQIDYQRLSENQEMLQIALDNPDTQIEIKRQGNKLLVRLKG